MGLLDEAIREHLELKRRRGADPGEVAREEREALEPVFAQGPQLDDEELTPPHGDELAEAFDEPGLAHVDPGPPAAAHASAPPEVAADYGLGPGGQETAELDMQEVLETDVEAADPGSPEAPATEPPEQIPGQERLTFE
jgi:hypothetical protein